MRVRKGISKGETFELRPKESEEESYDHLGEGLLRQRKSLVSLWNCRMANEEAQGEHTRGSNDRVRWQQWPEHRGPYGLGKDADCDWSG